MRPVLQNDSNKCCGCGSCASSCPVHCIHMAENNEGFFYPLIDPGLCIDCGRCKAVCPVLKCREEKSHVPEAWAVIAGNSEIQESSSSGGAFSLLATKILRSGGCVYGASFSQNFKAVQHIRIDQEIELGKIKTSKYLQSDTTGIYPDVQDQLNSGRFVLFSGTPCQIAGLRSFLGKNYEKLICVEVICHGVPSPKLWKVYLEHITRGRRISSVNFRHKKHGWKKFGMGIAGAGKQYYRSLSDDPYLQMFLKNDCLRESCYHCMAKACSGADLTLGDFWGVEKVAAQFADSMGTSLVLVHTEKGKELFESIAGDMTRGLVDYDSAIKHNSAYYSSVKRPAERDAFFSDLDVLPWQTMVKKYVQPSISKKLKRQLARSVRALKNKALKRMGGGKPEYGLLIRMEKNGKVECNQ